MAGGWLGPSIPPLVLRDREIALFSHVSEGVTVFFLATSVAVTSEASRPSDKRRRRDLKTESALVSFASQSASVLNNYNWDTCARLWGSNTDELDTVPASRERSGPGGGP